jgi:hypothetical protein
MIKITQSASGKNYGSAEFSISENGLESEGTLMFRVSGNKLEVLDPFGGLRPHALNTLRSMLEFELGEQGHLK